GGERGGVGGGGRGPGGGGARAGPRRGRGGARGRAAPASRGGRKNNRRAPDVRRRVAPRPARQTESPAATSASHRRTPRGLRSRARDSGPWGVISKNAAPRASRPPGHCGGH